MTLSFLRQLVRLFSPTAFGTSLPQAPRERAAMPHCDADVLHAPGECVYCDKYPDWQRLRLISNINFTGHHDPHRGTCPSERKRDLETIERWPGNIPFKDVDS